MYSGDVKLNLCSSNVLYAINKIKLTANAKRLSDFSLCMFEGYFFISKKKICFV